MNLHKKEMVKEHLLLEVIPLSFLYFLSYEIKIFRAIPIAIYEPKSFFAVFATLIDLVIIITYKTTTAAENINPNSSPITENIKSVVLGYKYPNCV